MAEETPQSPFTAEQLESLKSTVTSIVNSAISSRDKMADKKRADDRAAIQAEFSKLLDEKLSTFKPADDEGGRGGKEGKGGKGENVELATLRKQQADQAKQLEELKRERDEERARRRAGALRQTASEQLSKLGIDGSRFKGAFALLQQEGRIKHRDDDSDELVFVDDAGAEVDLEVGLAAWAKTDDAKIFLPPSGAKGSGSRPGTQQPPATLTKDQAESAAWSAAGEALKGAFGGINGSL